MIFKTTKEIKGTSHFRPEPDSVKWACLDSLKESLEGGRDTAMEKSKSSKTLNYHIVATTFQSVLNLLEREE